MRINGLLFLLQIRERDTDRATEPMSIVIEKSARSPVLVYNYACVIRKFAGEIFSHTARHEFTEQWIIPRHARESP